METISVAIPVRIVEHEQYEALLRCLTSVFSQSVRPCDVTISVDGNPGDLISSLKTKFAYENYRVVHNPNKPGIATNSNNALSYCEGDLVHVLHQDDEILLKDCYESVLEKFKVEKFRWLMLEGRLHSGTRIEPTFDSYTKFGINKMGGPSGLIVPREWYLPFNPIYSMMTDVVNFELYYRKHGSPSILPKPWILYGELSCSASRNIPRNVVIKELQMISDQFEVSNEEIRSFISNPKLDLTYRKLVFDSLGESIKGIHRVIFLFSYIQSKTLQVIFSQVRHRPSRLLRSRLK